MKQPPQSIKDLSEIYTKLNGTKIKSNGNDIRSIGIERKIINGIITDIPCITFQVKEKKPLSQLDKDKIVPKNIVVDGIEYVTDVVQNSSICKPLQCTSQNGCYGTNLDIYAADHRKKFRWYPSECQDGNIIIPGSGNPVQGGITIGQQDAGIGTLGCIVEDNVNGKLCGLSNNHVLVRDAFLASEKYILGARNLPFLISNIKGKGVTQPGEISTAGGISTPRFNTDVGIGFVKRYVPLYFFLWDADGNWVHHNYVDAAICSLVIKTSGVATMTPGDMSPTPPQQPFVLWKDSSKQFNMKFINEIGNEYTVSPTEYLFATEEEINNLPIGTRVWKSGRTTGFVGKGICNGSGGEDPEVCQLELIGTNEIVQVGPYNFSVYGVATFFSDCLKFAYKLVGNETTPRPGAILGGDSGSVLIADINGTKKIIGLNFAGGKFSDQAGEGSVGFANKIHYLTDSDGLNIKSISTANMFDECNYDNPNYSGYYDDPSKWKFRIEQGLSPFKKITLDHTYYQCGLFNK